MASIAYLALVPMREMNMNRDRLFRWIGLIFQFCGALGVVIGLTLLMLWGYSTYVPMNNHVAVESFAVIIMGVFLFAIGEDVAK